MYSGNILPIALYYSPVLVYMHVPKYYLPLTETIVIYCCAQHVILDAEMSPSLPAPSITPVIPLPKFQSTAAQQLNIQLRRTSFWSWNVDLEIVCPLLIR